MTNLLIKKDKIVKKQTNLSFEAGFTLVELSVVILIGGILMSFMGTALLAYMKKSQVTKTQFRIEKIKEAMRQYLDVNGRYPCAADRTIGPENSNFGREVTTTCNSGNFSGTVRDGGVRIGAVPTRTLNLPDEFIADAWGHKLTYAITENLATPLLYQADGGSITVQDSTGLSLVSPANTAHYVVVSHGRTGDGSFPLGASTNPSVPCPPAANALDNENCDDNNVFVATLVNSDAVSTNFYDDYVLFKGQTTPVFFIPEDAIFAFNLAVCPDGWSEYTNARGRFVIGSQPANKVANKYQMALSNPLQQANLDLSLGNNTEGDVESNIPPYVALLYCQKD